MLPFRRCLTFALLALACGALAAQDPPPARDHHGDPLPSGAVARLGTVRLRHDGPIVFAAFLPGGRSVMSVGGDGVVCVWELPSGKERRRFATCPAKERPADATATVTGASLSPDGKHLTTFGGDGFL